jgi:hypothetical protein
LVVQPASLTRRLVCVMKKSTQYQRKSTLSRVRKPQAMMLAAWARAGICARADRR